MRTVIAIQARMSSQRLPGKVLMDLNGRPLLSQLYRRMRAVKEAFHVDIACPYKDREMIAEATGVEPVAGPEDDILTRLMNVVLDNKADFLVRITADCPAMPPDLVSHGIREAMRWRKVVQNWRPRAHPDGFDFDIWPTHVLKELDGKLDGKDREWFASAYLDAKGENVHVDGNRLLSKLRLTVDYPEDLEVMRALYADMGDEVWGASLIVQWCTVNGLKMKPNEKYSGEFGARPKE